jgi:hypothetical protein
VRRLGSYLAGLLARDTGYVLACVACGTGHVGSLVLRHVGGRRRLALRVVPTLVAEWRRACGMNGRRGRNPTVERGIVG